ncbi:MAG TPA: HI0074 family nucleotidyltransferase substrate-binding subunit [Ramlibacter sp.]|uniref:HI0074 family nucleotidyltransferase substrate-binding subunit n=1 Tax=Ramlibacter sp. TaxID=1917967 RepID=UPI002C73A380|nr:HI0074 family nucleotidyltransferase substrate-binding subunit [Ramlibacter sp.]HVZ45465.1 HI0074 family nucleotidyltransferase substrate-binding subunit [Ramlibacter sp.]
MSRQRFQEHRALFDKALARLHEALAENETAIVRDALIQRFEFTFEMAWLSLFDYLSAQGAGVPRQAFAVIPLAFQSQLLADAQVWDQIRAYRNLTSHTYDEAKAIQVAAFIRSTAAGAFDVLQQKLRTL